MRKISKNSQLCLVFLVYLILVVLFAVWYSDLYHKDYNAFIFAHSMETGLLTEQAQKQRSFIQRKVDRLEEVQLCQRAISLYPDLLDPEISITKAKLDKIGPYEEYKFVHFDTDRSSLTFSEAPGIAGNIITCTVGDERALIFFYESIPDNKPQAISAIDKLADQYSVELHNARDSLKRTIDADSPEWTFSEFLYFSVSVQTTLGFGDVLPNSTLTRNIVIF